MSEEEIRSLILCLYRAARERPPADYQDAALGLVRSSLDFEAAWWGSGTVKDGQDKAPETAIFTSRFFGLDQRILEEYAEVAAQDTAAQRFLDGGSGAYRLVSSVDFAGKEKLGLRSLQKKYRQENLLIAGEIRPDSGYCRWISFFRPKADAHYSEAESNLAATLLPHLMEALTISCMLRLDTPPVEERRSALCRGVADGGGFVHYLEEPLKEWLIDEFGRGAIDRLPAAVIEHLRTQGAFSGRKFIVRGSWKDGLVLLYARPRRPADQLSKRELEVAKHIARGSDFRGISVLLNISPATVRTHTRNVYDKLDVSNQAQLIAEINLLR